jgi:hypothetical protein
VRESKRVLRQGFGTDGLLRVGRDTSAGKQQAKASPELKQAIDRIWQRIVDEGW